MTREQTNAEKLERVRWKCRTDLFYLAKEVLGYRDVDMDVHYPLLNILQKFEAPPLDQRRTYDIVTPQRTEYLKPWLPMEKLPGGRRRLILDPRGFYKTTINVVCHTVQWILNYPDIAILVVHARQETAEEMLSEIRSHFLYNPIMRDLFPEYCLSPKTPGSRGKFTVPNRRRKSRKESTVAVCSLDSSVAGMHFDVIKFTDVVDATNTGTRDQCRKTIQSFGNFRNILVSPQCWMDVEGTCYDYADLYNQMMDNHAKLKSEDREWQIHVRGCYKKDTNGAPYTFLPEERELRDLKDSSGNKISWFPKKFTVKELESMRKDETIGEALFACTPGDGLILQPDWTEKPIKDINVGDMVMGWRRDPLNPQIKPKLVPSRVIDKGSMISSVLEWKTDLGNTVRCTPDHLWWNGRKVCDSDTHQEYHFLKPGRKIKRVVPELPEYSESQLKDFFWLCGMLDGEGSFKHDGVVITQSIDKNPQVCKKLEEVFVSLGIPFSKLEREASSDNNRKSGRAAYYSLGGGRSLYRNFLIQGNLAKHSQMRRKLDENNGIYSRNEIAISCEDLGQQEVFWLQTETGNYVSQGYASKNCQQLNNPMDTGDEKPFPISQFRSKSAADMRKVPMTYYSTSVDSAESVNKGSDYSVVLTTGWDQNGRCYVVDVRHGKFQPDELIKEIFDTYRKWRPRSVRIEETGYIRGLKPSMRRFEDQTGIYLPFVFLPADNQRSKQDRILLTLQPWYKRGEIFWDESLGCLEHAKKELTSFPKGRTDDIIDALADQFTDKAWLGRETERGAATGEQFQSSLQLDEAQYAAKLKKLMQAAQDRKVQGLGEYSQTSLGSQGSSSSFFDSTGGM